MVATIAPARNGTTQTQKLGFVRLSVDDPRFFVDKDYQRDIEPTTQRKILRKGWDEAKAGVVLLNLRPSGQLAVVDGSNRLHGARSLSIKSVNTQIIQVPVTEEARLYTDLNQDRKANSALQLWKAMSNFDATVQEMNATLAKHGFKVALASSASHVNNLTCPHALHWIFQKGGIALLDSTMSIIAGAWPNVRDARGSTVIQGLAHFIAFNRHDGGRLLRVLAKASVTELISGAKDKRSACRWSPYYALSFGVLELYNKKLGENARLSPHRYYGIDPNTGESVDGDA